MNKFELLSFGSFTYDLIENHEGVKKYCVGGSGAYFSISASLCGVNVFPVGFISDSIDKETEEMIKRIVDTRFLKRKSGLTFHIKYDKDLKANYLKDLDEDEEIIEYKDFNNAHYVHVCVISNIDNQRKIIKHFQNLNSIVSSGTYLIRINKDRKKVLEMLKNSHFFFLNEEEAFRLSEEKELSKVFDFFKRNGKNVIITLGKNGALFVSKESFYKVNAIKTNIVDVTGAGESFAGGFIGSYIIYKDPLLALKYGVALSSFVIEDFGINRLLSINREDILKRLEVLDDKNR